MSPIEEDTPDDNTNKSEQTNQTNGGLQLEAEWYTAEHQEYQRLKREQRERRQWLANAAYSAASERALQLFKQATLYGGLGKSPEAIEIYQQFLGLDTANDALSTFARERISALTAEESE